MDTATLAGACFWAAIVLASAAGWTIPNQDARYAFRTALVALGVTLLLVYAATAAGWD